MTDLSPSNLFLGCLLAFATPIILTSIPSTYKRLAACFDDAMEGLAVWFFTICGLEYEDDADELHEASFELQPEPLCFFSMIVGLPVCDGLRPILLKQPENL